MSERETLARALHQAAPSDPVPADRAARAVLAGRRRRRRQRMSSAAAVAAVVAAVAVVPASLGWFRGEPSGQLLPPGQDDKCASTHAHADLQEGTPVMLRFCQPAGTWNGVVHTPRIALTDGVDRLVDGWTTTAPARCEFDPVSDQYRFQVVYDDGSVAQITGATGDCQPIVNGASTLDVSGLDVFAQIMDAYGEQLAARFHRVPGQPRLSCPPDPRHPESTDQRGPSDRLPDTGLVIPLPVEVGLLCVDARPYLLDHVEAQQVRVALQTITEGRKDCVSPNSTSYSVVLEDKTGTRRTISSIGAECGAIRSGFEGGPTGDPGQYLPQLLKDLAR